MKLTIYAKNMTVSPNITRRIEKKTERMGRYLLPETEMQIRLSKEDKRGRRVVEITVPMGNNVILRAEASEAENLFLAIDHALAKIERQIHRHRTKLGKRIRESGAKVYLVNTGWAGGSAADGAKRMKLAYTRAMVSAALNGDFDTVEFKHHDVFNVDFPTSCPGVPAEMLDARGLWADKEAYDKQANKLATMFSENFAKKYPNMPAHIVEAGPKAK